MSAGPDYSGAFRRMMAENADKVVAALDGREAWLWKKITTAAVRYGVSEDEIASALRECGVLRFYFAKDPQKQGMHENTAAEYISAIDGVEDFERGKQSGKSAVYVTRGEVVVGGENLRALRAADLQRTYSKSVDFLWRYGGRRFYAYHKFTGEEGGGQDNQASDVRTFLRESALNDAPECVFVALCDGEFYAARMDGMRAIAKGAKHGNVFAMTTGELPAFLRLGGTGK